MLRASSNSVEVGAEITRQLLSQSGGRSTVEPGNVRKMLDNAKFLISSEARRKVDLDLKLELRHSDVAIAVEQSHFVNAILNLVSNAKDALNEDGTDGTVEIRARSLRVDKVLASSPSSPDYCVQIDVSDTGVGMDSETVEHAFDAFYTTKANGFGTGLGLPSVEAFVVQSGGSISLDSTIGQGTTVTMFFPEASHAGGKDEGIVRRDLTDDAMVAALRCLVVEDNRIVRETLVAMLNHMGCQCVDCATADNAQWLLQNDSRFDVVVSDVHMPGSLNGVDLSVWMRDHCPKTAIILSSGNDAPPRTENGTFLSKPFGFQELAAALNKAVGSAASH